MLGEGLCVMLQADGKKAGGDGRGTDRDGSGTDRNGRVTENDWLWTVCYDSEQW